MAVLGAIEAVRPVLGAGLGHFFLVIPFADIGLAQERHPLCLHIRDDQVLVSVRFLLPTVMKCLFFRDCSMMDEVQEAARCR